MWKRHSVKEILEESSYDLTILLGSDWLKMQIQ